MLCVVVEVAMMAGKENKTSETGALSNIGEWSVLLLLCSAEKGGMIGVEIESLDMAVEEGSHGTQKLGYTID